MKDYDLTAEQWTVIKRLGEPDGNEFGDRRIDTHQDLRILERKND